MSLEIPAPLPVWESGVRRADDDSYRRECRIDRSWSAAIFDSSAERAAQLPADHGNFVYQQNRYSRERDPGRQRIASEEVEGHACPAGASRDQSAADIERSHCGREVCALDVLEPKELT